METIHVAGSVFVARLYSGLHVNGNIHKLFEVLPVIAMAQGTWRFTDRSYTES